MREKAVATMLLRERAYSDYLCFNDKVLGAIEYIRGQIDEAADSKNIGAR